MKNKVVQVILGAGRPFRGTENSSLKKVSSHARVLDWTLQAAKFLNPEVHFVAGYQVDEIISRYPSLHYTINPKWRTTGPIISLLEARLANDSEYLLSYGDILFREKTVRELINLDADVCIAVDSMWKERYSSRTLEDINSSEMVIISKEGKLDRSKDISIENANAEFIGLLTLKSKVMRFLQDNKELLPPDMSQANLTDLLEFLRVQGFSIKIVDVEGDWAELNQAHDLANFILGTKAQSLERLEEVITLSKIAPQVSFTVAEWNKDSEEIIHNIQSKFKSKKLIVRSSAISEDGFDVSNAGAYLSVLDIDSTIKKDICDSVIKVIDSYIDKNLANQVLVQPMIENVRVSGVIFTRTLSESAPYYVINFDDSSKETDTITSGSSSDSKTLIISRNNAEELQNSAPEVLDGLIPALQEIENLLDFNALDVEFAIDMYQKIHILQVRPLTSDKYEIDTDDVVFESIDSSIKKFKDLQNNSPFVVGKSAIFGVMPDWNPAEIIGTNPNVLSFDLYRYLITDDIWAKQRAEYGYRDVRPHPLLVSFSGHPYIDVRASFNSFIPATLNNELAGRLVDHYLLRLCENPHYHDKVEFEIVPTCYAFDFEDWDEILTEGGFSDDEIEELGSGLRSITKNAIFRTQEDLKTVEVFGERFDNIFSSNLPPLDKALVLLEDCRRYGTLVFAHLARSAFVSITLLKSAVDKKIISQAAMDSFLNSIETVAHEFINDAKEVADKKQSWPMFVDRYGHLRPGTYDITSETYADNVEKYLRPVVDQTRIIKEEVMNKNNEWLSERESFSTAISEMGITVNSDTVESFLRGSIEGREYAKFIFSRNLSAALDLISEYGEIHNLNRTQLANVSLGSLFSVRSGNIGIKDAHAWLINESNSYSNYYEKSNKIELPPLIITESDFNIFMYPSSQPNYIGSGRVSTEVAILSSEVNNQNSSSLEHKILLIPQADPGFDWIFGHNIAGLITKYGGGNSHMAIRANEFGLPAAIGVGEALYSSLSRASVIELDVTNRKIEIIR
tara:strand:- start:297 stop:3362 length:3066 start_codon:yes stop_codon:yes gene_type:complete